MGIQSKGEPVRAEPTTHSSEPWIDRWIRGQGWMDGYAETLQNWVGAFYTALKAPGHTLKNILHGTDVLGHPLHPAVTDVPLGAWTVMVLADWFGLITGRIPAVAGDFALVIGVLAALLAFASGWTDFHETYGHERRLAVTHGSLMTLVIVAMIVSFGMRLGGSAIHLPAIALSTIAYLVALATAYVGGHITFGLGTMVNHNAFAEGPTDFVNVGKSADFPEAKMVRVDAGGLPTLVVRIDGRLNAIGAVCSHAGGPLDEGKLENCIVTCPWHASRFDVRDGQVKGGPATFSQPQLVVRENDGAVEVKLEHPLH